MKDKTRDVLEGLEGHVSPGLTGSAERESMSVVVSELVDEIRRLREERNTNHKALGELVRWFDERYHIPCAFDDCGMCDAVAIARQACGMDTP